MKNVLIGIILTVICTGCNEGQMVPSLMYVNQLTIPKYHTVEKSTNIFITCRSYNK